MQRLKTIDCVMSLMIAISTGDATAWLVEAAAPPSLFDSFWVQMLESLGQG